MTSPVNNLSVTASAVTDPYCNYLKMNCILQQVQIFKALVLGEEERGQSSYQVMCFVTRFINNEFISSDAMSKLRQVGIELIRVHSFMYEIYERLHPRSHHTEQHLNNLRIKLFSNFVDQYRQYNRPQVRSPYILLHNSKPSVLSL